MAQKEVKGEEMTFGDCKPTTKEVEVQEEDDEREDNLSDLFSASLNQDDDGMDPSTGTFGKKENLEIKLKDDGKKRDVQSAVVRPVYKQRPISGGISGMSSRDCELTSEKVSSLNERDEQDLSDVQVAEPIAEDSAEDSAMLRKLKEYSDSSFDSRASDDDLEAYKQQVEAALA